MADFVFTGSQTGASAATAIVTEEVSFGCDIETVTLTSSAATSSIVSCDIQRTPAGGAAVSIFATAVATLATNVTAQGGTSAVSASQTTIDVSPATQAQFNVGIEANSLILVDSEQMLVTAVQGSPVQLPGGTNVQRLTVTRGANATTAATHAGTASVFGVAPRIPLGATVSTPVTVNVSTGFAQGDQLTVLGATGATNLGCAVAVNRR